jgi:hypothetical protein
MYGLKPVPFKKRLEPQAAEAHTLQINDFMAFLELL